MTDSPSENAPTPGSEQLGSGPSGAESGASDNQKRYWRANLAIVICLLVVWAVVSLGMGIWWVEPLNKVRIVGFPLGFWMAQQGAIYVFIVLILVYALAMQVLDRRYHVREAGD